MALERLDKLIASQRNISRSDAKNIITKNRVTVDNIMMKRPETKVDPELSIISIDKTPLSFKRNIYIMLNKPAGVLSASRDSKAKTVIDLLPEEFKRKNLFPAGRLDKDTEGLLIITDDGDFAHKMLSPKSKVLKLYIAQLDGEVSDKEIELFEKGIIFKDGTKCLPATLKVIQDKKVEVGIVEGKFHQVKKMFLAVGLEVQKLKRVKIGDLSLDENLMPSQAKLLCDSDLRLIVR